VIKFVSDLQQVGGFSSFFHNDTTEILLKVVLNTIKPNQTYFLYNNIVLSMLYAKICPKVRRLNEGECIMPSNLGTYFGI
jgi:hypothetical protein